MTAPRLQVWPDRLPSLRAWKVWRLEFTDTATVAVEKLAEEDQEELGVGPEFYLNDLLQLDPTDKDAVKEFIDSYGFLFGRYPDIDHRSLTVPLTERGSLLGAWPGWYLSQSSAGRELTKARTKLMWERIAAQQTTPFELIAETQLGLSWLRDVTRLAISHNEFRLEHLPEEWESERFGIPRPASSEEAFAILVTALNGGLQTVHPIVTVPDLIDDARGLSLAMGGPPVYSIIVAGIYNHVAEGATYKQCQNLTCPRPYRRFVRQTKGDTGAISEAPRRRRSSVPPLARTLRNSGNVALDEGGRSPDGIYPATPEREGVRSPLSRPGWALTLQDVPHES